MRIPPADVVTRLLREWGRGNRDALDDLMPLVYDELRRIAAALMRSERGEHTLQATALVHEAFARLAGSGASPVDRVHFMSLAARVMRRVLVDHARAVGRDKRGGANVRVTLVEAEAVAPGSASRLFEIDSALDRLLELDKRKARALEMKAFGGMTHDEIASALQVSVPTIERDLRMAKAWLRAELSSADPPA
jgi:RNA polymerase sigma factor (TIGR02999 family)